MIAAASPGTLSRIEEIRPPYSQPIYTVASRINADSAGSLRANANGSKIATPLIGPNPGSRPTMVPTKQPIRAIIRFCGTNATSNP
ncbi:hypothetical protein D3C78_1145510 [compost metagenome]